MNKICQNIKDVKEILSIAVIHFGPSSIYTLYSVVFFVFRPQLLVLVKVSDNETLMNQKLLQLAGQLKAGQGLTIVATLIEGDLTNHEDRDRAEFVDAVGH